MVSIGRYVGSFQRAVILGFNILLRVIHAALASLCRLLGVQPPAHFPIPDPDAQRDQVQSHLEKELEQSLSEEAEYGIGRLVYEFARERDPEKRGCMDLSALTPSQYRWLMRLSEARLHQLAVQGPLACRRAISAVKKRVRRVEPKQRSLRPAWHAEKRGSRDDRNYVLKPKLG